MLNLINFFSDEGLWGVYLAFEIFLFPVCWMFIYVSL